MLGAGAINCKGIRNSAMGIFHARRKIAQVRASQHRHIAAYLGAQQLDGMHHPFFAAHGHRVHERPAREDMRGAEPSALRTSTPRRMPLS